jgi:hypothetical protein
MAAVKRRPSSILPGWVVIVSLSMAFTAGCVQAPRSPHPVPLAVNATRARDAAFAQWLGVSSWIISRGSSAVVVDPFFSRPSLARVAIAHLVPLVPFEPSVERIDAVLPRLPEATTIVLVGHGHYDHLMDVVHYADVARGAAITWAGTTTVRNVVGGVAADLAFWNVDEAGAGSPLHQLRKGDVRITVVPGDHAPNFLWFELWPGTVRAPLRARPARLKDYQDGGAQMYVVDFFEGASAAPVWRVFVNGAATTPEAARRLRSPALDGFFAERDVDVAILCVPGWDRVEDYPRSVLHALRGRTPGAVQHVVLSHFDNFFSPFQPGQDPARGMDFLPFTRYGDFVNAFHEVNVGFRLHEPRTGECLRFGGTEPKLDCER